MRHDGNDVVVGGAAIGACALRETLVAVAAALAGARKPWWVIAGAACALHGAADEIADVDVLLDEGDAMRLLPPLGLSPAPGEPHPRFRSVLFATWRDLPIPVEFIAGFAIATTTGWHDVRPVTRERHRIGNAIVFTPARAELAAMLTLSGRPGDLARARRLLA
ncbi:hypothetical protein [Sphingomonas bacterium]|uniref:hypothetical protein n=1 Tax=Sphingomonas bacterium TaxID=1895847 RepID=UPI0020C6569E|nr:hypothetical protein [Sphingomonas bacterium]